MVDVQVAEVKTVTETVIANNNELLNLSFDEIDLELKAYASEHNVPIIFDEGLAFLETIIRLYKPKKILEIGTAIGYSAMRMHKACGSYVTTIERNPKMFEEATKNISKAGLSEKIEVIYKDALEAFEEASKNRYDMIFIDAAKAQYTKFFNLYTPLLNDGGIVVCDNMLFHGLVEDVDAYEKQTRSVRGLIRKLAAFHSNLLSNEEYHTSIFNIGDGMSVSIKKTTK